MDDNTKVSEQPELIDIKSYKAANKRVHFKRHIAIYALVMIVLWVLYFFIFRETPQPEAAQTVAEGAEAAAESATANAPAPMGLFLKCTLFVTILWTVILFFHYLFVYRLNSTMIDREIKNLKKEIEQKKATLEKLKEEAKQLGAENTNNEN